MSVLNWHLQQQRKRENEMNKNDIFLINQELKQLLQQVQSFINLDDFETEVREANRYIIQSSIWNVAYLNNLENKKVAVEQAKLIRTILKRNEMIPRGRSIEIQVEGLMRRLGNIDWGIYNDYRRVVQYL